MPDDKIALSADEVFADVINREGMIDAAPLHPCTECGKETKLHHTPAGSRICSNRGCRFVVSDPRVIAAIAAMGARLQPVVVPCPECGRPTKEHHTPPGSRVCSDRGCRAVISPP